MHGFYYDWKKRADESRDTIRSLVERILEGKARMNAYKERPPGIRSRKILRAGREERMTSRRR